LPSKQWGTEMAKVNLGHNYIYIRWIYHREHAGLMPGSTYKAYVSSNGHLISIETAPGVVATTLGYPDHNLFQVLDLRDVSNKLEKEKFDLETMGYRNG
jgi:hypothetical protein